MPVTIQPTSLKYKDSNNEFQTVTAIKGDSGVYYGETEPSDPNVKVWIDPNGEAETFVQDVQVNGVSVLTDGIANVPAGSTSDYGVFKLNLYGGLQVGSDGTLKTNGASASNVKSGTDGAKPLTPLRTSDSAFYGLAKAAGADMASSSNPIGTYTDEAKIAIQKMLGIYEAPWELIREDKVTNLTESAVEITVDGNGQPFELTDAIIQVVVSPITDVGGSIGDYGKIYFKEGSTEKLASYCLTNSTITLTSASLCSVKVTQDIGGLFTISYTAFSGVNNHEPMRLTNTLTGIGAPYTIQQTSIDNIKIGLAKGTVKYKLYGKRKWQ